MIDVGDATPCWTIYCSVTVEEVTVDCGKN